MLFLLRINFTLLNPRAVMLFPRAHRPAQLWAPVSSHFGCLAMERSVASKQIVCFVFFPPAFRVRSEASPLVNQLYPLCGSVGQSHLSAFFRYVQRANAQNSSR